MSLLAAHGLWVRPPGARAAAEAAAGGDDAFALRDLSLDLDPGEWLGVTGPNGGGKSSLLHALGGLWPATRGRVLLDGRPFAPGAAADQRGRVAVLLQDPSAQLLQPTVRDEIRFTARNLDQASHRYETEAARWADRLGLQGVLDADPGTLSAGYQQLVLLAAAMTARPEVLVADEPGAHLDASRRAVVLEALEAERGGGLALVWASQDATELARARRTLELGGSVRSATDEDWGIPPPVHGQPVIRLRVEPWDGRPGAHVACAARFEVLIPGTGVSAVVGPNGAGKSVILGAIAGIEVPAQIEVERLTAPDGAPLLVTQYPERLFFEEVVGDEVCFAAVSRGLDRRSAMERASICFERLGLGPGFTGRRVWELSGGQKRLAEVVAALIAPASAILLDEPTAGLDPERRRRLAELVAERAAGTPLVVASQDLDWLARLRARVWTIGGAESPDATSPSKKTD